MADKNQSIEDKRKALLRELEELDNQEKELSNVVLKEAYDGLAKKKIDFPALVKYYQDNHAPIIFQAGYLERKTGMSKTFTRRKGQIGVISSSLKQDLQAMGRDKLAEGIKDVDAGAKVLESIFKTGKAAT